MPELPEVEILARHLRPHLQGETIRQVDILRARSLRDCTPARFRREVVGQRIRSLERRAKYFRFALANQRCFLVHLGMTGRLMMANRVRPHKHDIARFRVGGGTLVFHDPRKFGHLALGDDSLRHLGPEPLGDEFTSDYLVERLRVSRAPIKVRLLDQRLVSGLGNIYVCEALWRGRIDPRKPCARLNRSEVVRLRRAIVGTLRRAIRFGGGLSLNFDSTAKGDGVFYYGRGARRDNPAEHFAVYDCEGKPCKRCRAPVLRITQSGRSTFFCRVCQAHR